MCCCCSACGRSLLSETQRGSTTLLITHENVLYLGLLQYHWQLVMMKKVDHGMLKEEIKLSKNAQPMYLHCMYIQNRQINLKKNIPTYMCNSCKVLRCHTNHAYRWVVFRLRVASACLIKMLSQIQSQFKFGTERLFSLVFSNLVL